MSRLRRKRAGAGVRNEIVSYNMTIIIYYAFQKWNSCTFVIFCSISFLFFFLFFPLTFYLFFLILFRFTFNKKKNKNHSYYPSKNDTRKSFVTIKFLFWMYIYRYMYAYGLIDSRLIFTFSKYPIDILIGMKNFI